MDFSQLQIQIDRFLLLWAIQEFNKKNQLFQMIKMTMKRMILEKDTNEFKLIVIIHQPKEVSPTEFLTKVLQLIELRGKQEFKKSKSVVLIKIRLLKF